MGIKKTNKEKPFWDLNLNPIIMKKYFSFEQEKKLKERSDKIRKDNLQKRENKKQ